MEDDGKIKEEVGDFKEPDLELLLKATEAGKRKRSSTEVVPSKRSSTKAAKSKRSSTEVVPSKRSRVEGAPSKESSTEVVPSKRSSTEGAPSKRSSTEVVPSKRSSKDSDKKSSNSSKRSSSEVVPSKRSRAEGAPSKRSSTETVPSKRSSKDSDKKSSNSSKRSSTEVVPSKRSSAEGAKSKRSSTEAVPSKRSSKDSDKKSSNSSKSDKDVTKRSPKCGKDIEKESSKKRRSSEKVDRERPKKKRSSLDTDKTASSRNSSLDETIPSETSSENLNQTFPKQKRSSQEIDTATQRTSKNRGEPPAKKRIVTKANEARLNKGLIPPARLFKGATVETVGHAYRSGSIHDQLMDMGRKLDIVLGDGNCMFESIARQVNDNKVTHATLRAAAVNEGFQNSKTYLPQFSGTKEEYFVQLTALKKDKVWNYDIGNYILTMLRKNFEKKIVLVQDWTRQMEFDEDDVPIKDDDIVIVYRHEHYDATTLIKNFTGEGISHQYIYATEDLEKLPVYKPYKGEQYGTAEMLVKFSGRKVVRINPKDGNTFFKAILEQWKEPGDHETLRQNISLYAKKNPETVRDYCEDDETDIQVFNQLIDDIKDTSQWEPDFELTCMLILEKVMKKKIIILEDYTMPLNIAGNESIKDGDIVLIRNVKANDQWYYDAAVAPEGGSTVAVTKKKTSPSKSSMQDLKKSKGVSGPSEADACVAGPSRTEKSGTARSSSLGMGGEPGPDKLTEDSSSKTRKCITKSDGKEVKHDDSCSSADEYDSDHDERLDRMKYAD